MLERFATIVLAEGYRGRRRFEIIVGKFTGVCVCAHLWGSALQEQKRGHTRAQGGVCI